MQLNPEDYLEPACPLCMDPDADKKINIKRVIEKLDEFLNKNDYSSAENHLNFWLKEATVNQDESAQISLYNERMGLLRKLGKGEPAIADAKAAMELIAKLNLSALPVAGTTFLNAATVYKAFCYPQKALLLYEQAFEIYKKTLPPTDSLFGGLYNNMGLALVDLKQFDRADDCYQNALRIMKQQENGEADCAITYLNMADAAVARMGMPQAEATVFSLLDTAADLLNSPRLPRNGYYAFVAEKCAPTFRIYGYFAYANELEARSRRIYEGA